MCVCDVSVCCVMLLMLCCYVMCCGWAVRVVVVVGVAVVVCARVVPSYTERRSRLYIQNAPVCAVKTHESHVTPDSASLSVALLLDEAVMFVRVTCKRSSPPTDKRRERHMFTRLWAWPP